MADLVLINLESWTSLLSAIIAAMSLAPAYVLYRRFEGVPYGGPLLAVLFAAVFLTIHFAADVSPVQVAGIEAHRVGESLMFVSSALFGLAMLRISRRA